MIPGFPLDGGRVLRAIVWAITKNADGSTRTAARVGQVVAFLFILYGIWGFFNGAGFNGLWMVFIGWFLMDAAKASYAQVDIAAAFRGMRVSDVMSHDCVIVNRGMGLQEFVDTYLLRTGQRCFAVEDHDRLVGLITPRDVGAIPRERWNMTTVREAMRPLEELHVITPDTQVLDALKLMAGNDVNQLPVVADGALQGVFSRSQLMQLLQARSELQLPAAHYPPLHRKGNEARHIVTRSSGETGESVHGAKP
jgi:CBS domain-containing protein